jgi:hypothetical protein
MNTTRSTGTAWRNLAGRLKELGDVSLSDFLTKTGIPVQSLYLGTRSGWTALRRTAGFSGQPADAATDARLGRAFGRMLHTDDVERLTFLTGVLDGYRPANTREQRLLAMLDCTLWGGTDSSSGAVERLALIGEDRATELRALAHLRRSLISATATPTDAVVPLVLHATYSRNEALAAFGLDRPAFVVEGVKYFPEHRADVFFVTIEKAEGDYSETTRYHDHAITETDFQWQSQGRLRATAAPAHRYINSHSTVHLFIRRTKRDTGLGAPPYTYAGTMRYVSHEGEQPITFVWRMDHALPPEVFTYALITG